MATRQNFRTDRLGDSIAEVLGRAFLRDAADPRLADVSITGVRVSGDLRTAKVLWVRISDDSERERFASGRALRRATGFLRARLGEELRLRHLPEISFEYDTSIERGRRMDAILSDLAAQRDGTAAEGAVPPQDPAVAPDSPADDDDAPGHGLAKGVSRAVDDDASGPGEPRDA